MKLNRMQVEAVAKEVMDKIQEKENINNKLFLKNNIHYKNWKKLKKENDVLKKKLNTLNETMIEEWNKISSEVRVKGDYLQYCNNSAELQITPGPKVEKLEAIKRKLVLETIEESDINIIINKLVTEFSK